MLVCIGSLMYSVGLPCLKERIYDWSFEVTGMMELIKQSNRERRKVFTENVFCILIGCNSGSLELRLSYWLGEYASEASTLVIGERA